MAATILEPQNILHLPWPWVLVFVTCAIPLYWFAWIVYTRTLHPLSSIPGPFWASVTRGWYMLQIFQGDMDKTQRRLHQEHGPLIRIAPNEISCADPAAIKTIYPNHNPLTKTDFYEVWAKQNLSPHPMIFTITDETLHSQHRRIINPVYSLSNVLKLERYIDKCTALLTKRFSELAESRKSIDICRWFQMYAFDVLGELYFGKMFGFMEHSHDHGGLIHALHTYLCPAVVSAVAPSYLRPLIYGSTMLLPSNRAAMKATDYIEKCAKESVQSRVLELEKAQSKPREDMLQQLLDIANKGEKSIFGISEVELDGYVAFLAGSDTTSIELNAVLYYIMKHPSVYKEVMKEIDSAFENGKLSSPIKYSESLKLPLMTACIKEAMRLHPSVGLCMPRNVTRNGIHLCGKFIPAGYRVGMNAVVIHRDKSIFGEDANQYRPQRWLEGDTTNMDKHLLQFGAGKRTCIGKNISLCQLHKMIPELLHHFTFEFETDKEWKTKARWFFLQENFVVRASRRYEA